MITSLVGDVQNKTLTVLGLAFKAETDDIRESPSIYIVNALLNENAIVKVFDPKAMNNMKKLYTELDVQYCDNEYSACLGSDCIIVATEWEQFKNLDFANLKNIVNNPILVDLKNLYEPKAIRETGFIYKGIGRQ